MTNFLSNAVTWIKTNKTYTTIAIGLGLGVAQALGTPVPEWIYVVLGFAGIGFHRASVANIAVQVSALMQAVEATKDDKS